MKILILALMMMATAGTAQAKEEQPCDKRAKVDLFRNSNPVPRSQVPTQPAKAAQGQDGQRKN